MPVFETSEADALGLWTSLSTTGAASFGIEPGSQTALPGAQVYRVNLPADPISAQAAFRDSESAFEQAGAALDEVPGRLAGLVTRVQASRQQQAAGASFDLGAATAETGPEADLLARLGAAQRQAAGEPSFGIGETLDQAWSAARAQLDALNTQIERDILQFAWVETSLEAHLIARTVVNWSGDAQTLWQQAAGADHLALHRRALTAVTKTRNLRLRLFVTVTSGAARAAGLISTPGGALLALPFVYQYVLKIVSQAREIQSIQTSFETVPKVV